MYTLASKLVGLPLLSLQTGFSCGTVKRLVIDPGRLEVVAFEGAVPRTHLTTPLLMYQDVREIALDCVIIDSEDEIGEAEDVIRIAKLNERPFALKSQVVVTDLGRRLGRVEDYTINLQTALVQKLYVRQSIIHSLFGASLIIDRAQIIDVSAQHITVRDTAVKATARAVRPIQAQNT